MKLFVNQLRLEAWPHLLTAPLTLKKAREAMNNNNPPVSPSVIEKPPAMRACAEHESMHNSVFLQHSKMNTLPYKQQ